MDEYTSKPISNNKDPVILPKSSQVTSLVIGDVHERTHHSGRGITLNELLVCGYWFVNGNSVHFRVRDSFKTPLGNKRWQSCVDNAPPFTWCVQQGRTVVKRYGALFPCLASREEHVEVPDFLEIYTFIYTPRRFIHRR